MTTADKTDLSGSTVNTLPFASISEAKPYKRMDRWIMTPLVLVVGVYALGSLMFNPRLQWPTVGEYMFSPIVMNGLLMTLLLTGIAMVIGVVLGTVLALMRMSNSIATQFASWLFIWFFRSVPTLVLLILLFNISILIPEVSIGLPFGGPSIASWPTNDLMTPFIVACIGLGFHKAAYMGEIIRSGFLAVDSGQKHAAQALALPVFRTFYRIMLPQAMRVIIPPSGNELISTLKLTSLVSVISMTDLLYSVQSIYNQNFQTIPLLVVAIIWYLILTSLLQAGQTVVERHYGRGFTSGLAGTK